LPKQDKKKFFFVVTFRFLIKMIANMSQHSQSVNIFLLSPTNHEVLQQIAIVSLQYFAFCDWLNEMILCQS